MGNQYPLPLPVREAMGADDFMVGANNVDAVSWVDGWPNWPSHCLIIYGGAGAGKTHLAHVWQKNSHAEIIHAEILNNENAPILAKKNALVIDRAEAVAGDKGREEALFHLYNMIGAAHGHILLLADKPPKLWGMGLADLSSRLLSAPAVEMGAVDDAMMAGLLIKQLSDRQLDISQDLIDFILPRTERSAGAVRDLVEMLDKTALAENRRITIPLARHVFDLMAKEKELQEKALHDNH